MRKKTEVKFFIPDAGVDEVWRIIPGYDESYSVSNYGRVRVNGRWQKNKLGRFKYYNEQFRKLRRNANGYVDVDLSKNKVYKHHVVHRLVACAFIPNDLCKPFVNHIDGDKTNNHCRNLEWVTTSENIKHAFKIGLMNQDGERHPSHKLNNAQVVDIYTSSEKAAIIGRKYGVCQSMVSAIRVGKCWDHITKDLKRKSA